MKTNRINLISGPRNISTALMYSFANRPDTDVVDEPMYAYYLDHTQIQYHPGTECILNNLPRKMVDVQSQLIFNKVESPVYFIKGMAHHYVDVDLSFLLELNNVFLIRDPYQLIASFAEIIESPTLQDIGLKKEWDICKYIIDHGGDPIVIDSNDILDNPKLELQRLCNRLDIPFVDDMLRWPKGPISQDGVWGKYWYNNVWKSSGFQKQKSSNRVLSVRLHPLYEESLEYYNLLKAYC